MNKEELDYLISEHEKWFDNNSTGSRLILTDRILRRVNLSGRRLNDAILKNIDFSNSLFIGTKMYRVKMENVVFAFSNLAESELNEAKMNNIDFSNACLEASQLADLKFAENINFNNANMKKISFIKSSLNNTNFENSSLIEADFLRANIYNSSFINADLRKANFSRVLIENCKIERANIEDADFSNASEFIPEEWKQKIGWYSEEEQLKKRVKAYLKDNP